jgi:hypothetical protein
MFDRENAIGVLFLGLCLVVGGVLVYGIVTDTSVRYSGPEWLGVVLMILFFAAAIYGTVTASRRWPHPLAGRDPRRWWRRKRDDRSDMR